jgi:LacI family transcriptional regulator
MKVTIDDVVKRSGLSYVTVSRVISNSPNVRESNRKKVMEAIEELGYIPSAAARSLATGKTYVIAMFISDLGDDFFDSIIKEINDRLLSNGYLLSLIVCDESGSSTNTAFLSQNRVDGAILLVPNREKYFIDIFKSKKIPFVVIDNQTMNEDITSVMADNIAGGYMATRHLIDLGHRKIGFIGASANSLSTMERQLGANRALAEAELTPFATWNGDYNQPTGYDAVIRWKKDIGLPSAIFAFDDHIAVGAINAIKDLGLRVPEDISVCGYDDSLLANHYYPRITSVRQPAEEMAGSAVDKLIALIDRQEVGSYAMRFPPKLMVKASTTNYTLE